MTKAEIIASTLENMHREAGSFQPAPGTNDSNYYESSVVIPTLVDRLPDAAIDIKTCHDFMDLLVDCCKTCHALYPHYEMCLQALPGGQTAWICCAVRDSLMPQMDRSTSLDFDEALEGKPTSNGKDRHEQK